MGLTTQSLGRTAHLFSSNYSDCNKLYREVIIAIFYPLVPPVRQYLRFTVREPPTGQSDPPIGQLEARIRVGRPIHLLLLANWRA